jgi:Concanavalin A-like lectin/glucanases superfamily/PEP-CTERM motif
MFGPLPRFWTFHLWESACYPVGGMKLTPIIAGAAVIAGTFLIPSLAPAQTTSYNTGSLGAAGNGTNSVGVITGLPGVVTAGGDLAVGYSGGERTTVPYNAALNPPSSSPFTIEFWAKPFLTTDDAVGPAPLFNRVTPGNRSGWVFFQRSPTTGWNFRMYDGNGSNVGFSLEGGSNAQDIWTHVVAVWNGTSPTLYVNGTLADDTSTGSGIYNASTSAIFSIGSYDDGSNPFNGAVDETAFYNRALTPAQILAHFNAVTSPAAGIYSSLVIADGAVEYLQNNGIPEPSSIFLLASGLIGWAGLKRRRT